MENNVNVTSTSITKRNKWIFFVIFIIYSIVSTNIFAITSGGWSGIIIVFISGLVFTACALVLLIVNLLSKDKIRLSLSKGLLFALAGIQILTLLFNVGDCGDGEGSYQFFQILVGTNGWNLCNTGKVATIAWISPVLFFLYFIMLIIFLLVTYCRTDKPVKVSRV